MKLKWSQFILTAKSKKDKRLLIYNTLNDQVISISSEIKNFLDQYIGISLKKNDLPLYIQEYLSRLTELEILIPEKVDERDKYLQSLPQVLSDSEQSLSITLLTTTNCQFNCPYCFEKGISRKNRMNKNTADQTLAWCNKYLHDHSECQSLDLVLFGGEPLLNKDIIYYLLPQFKTIAAQNKVVFTLAIFTNGEFLDLPTLSLLNENNLTDICIPLDGPRDIHNQRRTRADGQNTFDTIIDNITQGFTHDLFKNLTIGITYDQQNVATIPQLLDFMKEKGLADKLSLTFNTTNICISEKLTPSSQSTHFNRFGLTEKQNIQKYLWLCQEAKKRGFAVRQKWFVKAYCSAKKNNSLVIEPNGSIQKCHRGVGHPEFIIGDISSPPQTSDPRFSKPQNLDSCFAKKCPVIPLCHGGCRFDAGLLNGDFSLPFCHQKFLIKVNQGLLQLRFG